MTLAALLAAQAVSVAVKMNDRRKAAERAAILADPLANVAMPNSFAIEVPESAKARSRDDGWVDYCRRARTALIEEARTSSGQIAQNE